MHPYRDASPDREPDEGPAAEEWIIAGMLALLGVARTVIALARAEDWGADVTIAALLGAVGLVMLVRLALRAR